MFKSKALNIKKTNILGEIMSEKISRKKGIEEEGGKVPMRPRVKKTAELKLYGREMKRGLQVGKPFKQPGPGKKPFTFERKKIRV